MRQSEASEKDFRERGAITAYQRIWRCFRQVHAAGDRSLVYDLGTCADLLNESELDRQAVRRLQAVRGFARYVAGFEPDTRSQRGTEPSTLTYDLTN